MSNALRIDVCGRVHRRPLQAGLRIRGVGRVEQTVDIGPGGAVARASCLTRRWTRQVVVMRMGRHVGASSEALDGRG